MTLGADLPSGDKAGSGIDGLDLVLCGGFPRSRIYLIQGDPGAGKTTLAMQFLLEGARRGERCLYVTLSETEDELRSVSAAHGWDLAGISFFSLPADDLTGDENTFFHSSEVELGETTRRILEELHRLDPARVVIDSLSEIYLLAQTALRFRRQVLALKHFFAGRKSTVLMLEDQTEPQESELRSIVNGVIVLQQTAPAYGAERRRLSVVKLRGTKYRGGYHDFRIEAGGIVVYPRLVASDHNVVFPSEAVSTGVHAFDHLLGGGLDRGTSILFLGPAGSGKSSLATQCAAAAALRGERAAILSFDEGLGTLVARSEGLGVPFSRLLEEKLLLFQQVNSAELSHGEFAQGVRRLVEQENVRLVVIDSLNGYLVAMPEERALTTHLHELFSYLRQRGVIGIATVAEHGLVAAGMAATSVDVSYIADTVILFRYYEAHGAVHKAVSVMKKRRGAHESTIRELCMSERGIEASEPLQKFRGVLTGVPVYSSEPLTQLR